MASAPRFRAPRLYSLEERRRGRGLDPELQAIARHEVGLPLTPDDYLSYEMRNRRRAWFSFMLLLSIFPFMSILVVKGKFDAALSWYTKGEVDTLSRRQKRCIRVVMILQFVAWPLLLFFLIWKYRTPGLPGR